MNIRKIIKEELFKEVGGYDDPSVMAQHAGKAMGALASSHNDLSNLLSGIANQVMEDDVILQAKKAISSLKSFKRKIDVLSNFSDSMGNDEQFIERVKLLLMDLIPTLKEYGDQLMVTNKMFGDRLKTFGAGFSSN